MNKNKIVEEKESQILEFKKSLAERDEILETISAFANTGGGNICIGIEENKDGTIKNIVGIKIKGKEVENLTNEIKQNTDPIIFPSVKVEKIKDKDILVISVQENPIKPVFAKGKVYQRVGRSNQKLSTLEIRELARKSTGYNFTESICKECKLEDIDESKIKKFIERAKEERNFNVEYKSKKDFLNKMHLLDDNCLKYSAILLFGKEPQRYVLQSEVRCGRFKGIKPLEFEDMEVIKGALIEQVEEVMKFVKRNLKVEATFGEGIERKERWEYPLLAIKEGIINAVCHRDYALSSNVQVRIFDDRLEIWSPGQLVKGITVEKLKGKHESVPRNKPIANAFFMVKFVEQWGTGTNKMIRECSDYGLPDPDFEETGTSFIVVFRKYKLTEEILRELNERQRKAIEYIKERNKITSKEYCLIAKVVKDTAHRDIMDLLRKKIIKKEGRGKTVFYVLK